MDKEKMKKLLEERTKTTREDIKPVDLYALPDKQPEKPTSTQVAKTTSRQGHKTTRPQVDKTTSTQVDKITNPQVHKYTTHLTKDEVKQIKKYAFRHEIKDYEVIREALRLYFNR